MVPATFAPWASTRREQLHVCRVASPQGSDVWDVHHEVQGTVAARGVVVRHRVVWCVGIMLIGTPLSREYSAPQR